LPCRGRRRRIKVNKRHEEGKERYEKALMEEGASRLCLLRSVLLPFAERLATRDFDIR